MKIALLDATELSRDWLCAGLKYQILDHTGHFPWLSVVVPPSVVEETIANHGRQRQKAEKAYSDLADLRRRLGVGTITAEDLDVDYRKHLLDRFESLGITVLEWPTISHADLVKRAVTRTPPFDDKGSGYRDSLVWEHALELAREGADVALVSADGIFAGPDNELCPAMAAEVAPLQGTIELVRDFGKWLLNQLPWNADSLVSALAVSRNDEFLHYFLHSDFDVYLTPEVEDLGFHWSPYSCEIIESRWNGLFTPVDSRTGPDGLTLVEYDIDQIVSFEAVFPALFVPEPGWTVSAPDILQQVNVSGEIELLVRIAVLFGGESRFSVEQLDWRRTGRTSGPGASLFSNSVDPNQLSLLDQPLNTEPTDGR